MRVLFVDNDESALFKLKYALSKLLDSLILDLASTSHKALHLLSQHRYDVVITESIPDFVQRESPEEYLERVAREQVGLDRRNNFRLSSDFTWEIDKEEYTGVQVAQAAKEKGTFVIGLCPDPIIFKRLAGDSLDLLMDKGFFDLAELLEILEKRKKERNKK